MHDITLADSTQTTILRHLTVTEHLLACVASQVSGCEQAAEIWAMPDLGLPYNVGRIHGGFFTGALYTWQSHVPIVPVDATVNVCSTSIFEVVNHIPGQEEFDLLIRRAIRQVETSASYVWNFGSGNHFIIYGEGKVNEEVPTGKYLILHSSAGEFKRQHNGLYPTSGNWYWDKVKTISTAENRYIRYIEGNTAEQFIRLAQLLESFQQIRHQYFAELLLGAGVTNEVLHVLHYGMPTWNSVAIGCQWDARSRLVPLLTSPGRPLFIVSPYTSQQNQVLLDGRTHVLTPHGLGVESAGPLEIEFLPDALAVNGRVYSLERSLMNETAIKIRDLSLSGAADKAGLPQLVVEVLSKCPARVVGSIQPLYTYSARSHLRAT